jgi:long-chain acyl-CoA synthetase
MHHVVHGMTIEEHSRIHFGTLVTMENHLTRTIHRARQVNPAGIATMSANRRQTWDQFVSRVARLAAGLVALGVEPGQRIAILANNSDRYLEAFFAIAWAGGVFVPVNTRLAPPEVAYWLNDSGASTLLVDAEFERMLPALAPSVETVEHRVFMDDGESSQGLRHYEALIDGSSEMADAGRKGPDLAGIFYTGGTTGVSKGVMLSHANLMANAYNVIPALEFTARTNWLHAAPMFHLADGTATFGVALVAGSHCFVPKFEPEQVLHAIEKFRATNSVFVPTMINMLVNHPSIERHDLSSMRGILYGASPMPEALLERALELMPGIQFVQGYGQTEAAPMMTVLEPERHVVTGPLAGKIKSVGQAALGIEVRILDTADEECPRGTIGEICGRGPNVMMGYWNKPDLSAATLRNGWLHTGDAGYMDEDGFIFIVDRLKDMIISGGENVYSAEVENAIYQLDSVAECAVIGVPDERWGERVHAIVRVKSGHHLTSDGVIEHCHGLIAGYKCPRSVDLVDEPLPLSGAGKILKSELRKPFWAQQDKNVN